jgi:hypothetical protein
LVVLVQLQQHQTGHAEASPLLGVRLVGPCAHERKGESQRVIEQRPRAEEEPVPATLRGLEPLVQRFELLRPRDLREASVIRPAGFERDRARRRSRREHHGGEERRVLVASPGGELLQQEGAGVASRRERLHPEEGHQEPARLAAEPAREPPRRALELGLAPLGLGPADLGRPPVLQRGEDHEQHVRQPGHPQPAV